MFKKQQVAIITNPKSGNYNKRILRYAREFLQDLYEIKEITLIDEQPIGNVISYLNSEKTPIIIFAFGDGTINSAINALIQTGEYNKFKIGVIPMGTANVLAKELNIDNVKAAINAIIFDNVKKVYLGKVYNEITNNFRFFSLMTSAGVDSLCVKNINEKLKKWTGKFAYIYEMVKLLFKKNGIKNIKTIVDNIEYENVFTTVSNGKYYGGSFELTNNDIGDKGFDILMFKKINFWILAKYLFVRKSEEIITLKADKVRIESECKDFPFQIDGDYYFDLPINIETTDMYINCFYYKGKRK